MSEQHHWHPVAFSKELGRRPRPFTLWGDDFVLFRSGDRVGAMPRSCPHRSMDLAKGTVEDGRLTCPYHGWSFDTDGNGRCPASPARELQATVLDAVEREGAIWVKGSDTAATFPHWGHGYRHPMGSLRQRIEAPLELVLDNFTEVEHTPRTHLFLGYAEETISEVQSHTEATNDSVRVVNKGQQKPIPRLLERLFGIVPGDIFVDEWVTRFSPVHTQYFHYWEDPETGEPRPDQLITTVFFNPVDRHTTDLFTFIEARGPQSDSPWLRRILKPIVRGLVRLEVVLDQRLLESITDKRTELDGRRLGRFDKALAENRKRLKSIYRGDP